MYSFIHIRKYQRREKTKKKKRHGSHHMPVPAAGYSFPSTVVASLPNTPTPSHSRRQRLQLTHASDPEHSSFLASFLPSPSLYSSSSVSSTVARGGRCVTSPAGAASWPVGLGAESTFTGCCGAWAGVEGREAFAMPLLPLNGTPLALAAALAAFLSFLAAFLALMSSGVWEKKRGSASDFVDMQPRLVIAKFGPYLLPCPYGTERIKETNVLKQIRI